jgi:uracil-DNA glycosylase
MQACTACDLHKFRTQVVFGTGNINQPKIFIIGEAPGEDEDLQGVPFIGRAGKQLDKMLAFANVKREDIFISNAALCRPPNNRTPTFEEMTACRWRLHLQIKLIKPKLIVILGKAAMTTMLSKEFKGPLSQFMKTDTIKFTIDGEDFNALVSYHPSYHLRNPIKAFHETVHIWTRIRDFVRE